MIKKVFFIWSDVWNGYHIPYDLLTKHDELYTLHGAFDLEVDSDLIACEVVQLKYETCIYSYDFIKNEAQGLSEDLQVLYKQYYHKRWIEIPKVKLSKQDWLDIQNKYWQIYKSKSYAMVSILDDSGPLHKIDIIGQNELSAQDIAYIQQEHEKYLKYEQAREQYMINHPDYSSVWRGPQDNEFEADIMKYSKDRSRFGNLFSFFKI